jgi:hypothetical protein
MPVGPSDGRPGNVTPKQGLKFLRDFIKTIDHKGIGIEHPDDVGLHSIRSSTAMAMYINHDLLHTVDTRYQGAGSQSVSLSTGTTRVYLLLVDY